MKAQPKHPRGASPKSNPAPRLKNKKSLGQHWLKNRAILEEIADLAVPASPRAVAAETISTADSLAFPAVKTAFAADSFASPAAKTSPAASASRPALCLEIGPGLGTLTSSLLRRFEKVIAIEFDERLAHNLPASFPGKNLEVINADFLQFDLTSLSPPFSVVGNIPYYITSPIIKKLLLSLVKPQKIVLLIQREVAERIAAEPGDHSLLSLFVQNLAEVELGPVVPAAEFTPPPKVDSEVIVLTPLPEPIIPPACLDLAKIGFSSPRKKLVANLSAAHLANSPSKILSRADWTAILSEQGINPDARAQDLSLWDWENLCSARDSHLNPA